MSSTTTEVNRDRAWRNFSNRGTVEAYSTRNAIAQYCGSWPKIIPSGHSTWLATAFRWTTTQQTTPTCRCGEADRTGPTRNSLQNIESRCKEQRRTFWSSMRRNQRGQSLRRSARSRSYPKRRPRVSGRVSPLGALRKAEARKNARALCATLLHSRRERSCSTVVNRIARVRVVFSRNWKYFQSLPQTFGSSRAMQRFGRNARRMQGGKLPMIVWNENAVQHSGGSGNRAGSKPSYR